MVSFTGLSSASTCVSISFISREKPIRTSSSASSSSSNVVSLISLEFGSQYSDSHLDANSSVKYSNTGVEGYRNVRYGSKV